MSVEELEFSVAYVSSTDDDDDRSLRNLMTTEPWISSKYCHYPQEVVLRFIHKVNIERIDILCHHEFIPEEIELYMGNSRVGEKISMTKAEYENLGSVHLHGEIGKNELKSVHVDANGWFLKLVIDENFKSRQNKYNQVAINEISAVGYIIPEEASDISDDDSFEAVQRRSKAYREGQSGDRDSSPGSDTDADVSIGSAGGNRNSVGFPTSGDKSYVDEMRNVLKIIEKEKKVAINGEKFEYAKKLKLATTKLKLGTDEIDKLEREKREAIGEEDFDKALDCKEEILAIRASTYADIDLQRLLTEEQKTDLGLIPKPKKTKEKATKPRRPSTASSRSSRSSPTNHKKSGSAKNRATPVKSKKLERSDRRPVVEVRGPTPEPESSNPEVYITPAESNNIYDATTRPQPNSLYDNPFERKEHTVLPAVQKKLNGGQDSGREPSPEPEEYVDPTTEEQLLNSLPDKERSPVSAAINQFGFTIVQKIYSKNWQHRKEGFEDLQQYLENVSSSDRAVSVLPETLKLIRKGLNDKVYAVYRKALMVLKYLHKEFLGEHQLIKSSSGTVAEKTYDILMTRTGDSVHDSRFRSDTIEFVLDMLKTSDKALANAYTSCIFRPFEATGAARIDEGHCEIAERIVEEIGAPNKQYGLDESRVCSFAMSCTQHTDPEVRQAGARLMIHMYKHSNKTKVRSFLPSENSTAVSKNPLLKALFDEFDRIDGGKGSRIKTGKKIGAGRATTARARTAKPKPPKRSASTGELKRLQTQNENLRKQLARSNSTAELSKSKPKKPATAKKSAIPTTNQKSKVSPAIKKRATTAKPLRSAPTAPKVTITTPKSPKPARSKSAKSARSVAVNDKLCPFCGEQNDSFDEAGLDEHYLKTCPMLKKCPHCKQMYEISTLKTHWLSECPNKSKFHQCDRCQEPIVAEEYAQHTQKNTCPPHKVKSKAARCVLCHKDVFPDNDVGWRKHLIGQNGCSHNPRKLLGIGAHKPSKKKDSATVPVLKLY